jgi:hypothetical protein
MLKEVHTISYIQQASHEWIKGDEEEIIYAQATKNLKVVPMDIQHGPEVLQRFKVAHEPLVKALSTFENMESHGESINLVLHQLIIWTPPKEGCHNPSLGLATKARACKGAGQEGGSGVTSHAPRSVGECEGMHPQTPK